MCDVTFEFVGGPLDGLRVKGTCDPLRVAQYRDEAGAPLGRLNWYDWHASRCRPSLSGWHYVLSPQDWRKYVWAAHAYSQAYAHGGNHIVAM